MSITNTSSNKKGSRGHIEIFLYRASKKNHDEMVEVNRQSRDFFTKCHPSGFEVFSLDSRENVMEFVNLSKLFQPMKMKRFGYILLLIFLHDGRAHTHLED